jgi:hypothetical protein
MNVGPPLVADPQPAELVQPAQGSLHYPPIDTQPPPMPGEPLGQDRPNPQQPQCSAMRAGIIGTLSLDLVWPAMWTPSFATHWRNGLYKWQH